MHALESKRTQKKTGKKSKGEKESKKNHQRNVSFIILNHQKGKQLWLITDNTVNFTSFVQKKKKDGKANEQLKKNEGCVNFASLFVWFGGGCLCQQH